MSPALNFSRSHECQCKDTAFAVDDISVMLSEGAIHLACSWYSLAADSSSASLSPPADLILQQGVQEHSGGACIFVLRTVMRWWHFLTSAQATKETLMDLRKPLQPPAKQAERQSSTAHCCLGTAPNRWQPGRAEGRTVAPRPV